MCYVFALYFFVRYASCSMCMRCDVVLANQCWGELPGQLGGLGRTGGWGHARERVLGATCVRGKNRVVVVYLGCVGYGDTETRLLPINA